MRFLPIIFALLLLPMTGCETMFGSSNAAPEAPSAPAPDSFYYDFKDIRVPAEMEIQPDKSVLTPTSAGKAGLIKFRGRAEPISLFDFFANNMPKDGWTLLTYQKYQRYLLVFSKENRISVITIYEDPLYYTWADVWVSPRTSGSPVEPSSSYPSGADSYTQPGEPAPMSGEQTLTQ